MKLTIINSVRTNNFNDSFLIQKITRLWKESSNRLTNKEIITYAVYHNYESNYKGDYSLSMPLKITIVNLHWKYRIMQNMKYSMWIQR